MKYDQIHALVRAHYDGNRDWFKSLVFQVAAGMRDKEKGERLRALTETTSEQVRQVLGKDATLVDEMQARELSSLMLDDAVLDNIKTLVEERKHGFALAQHNLAPRSKVLLHGPPGNGKTSLARAIATELRLNAYSLQLAEVRSQFMGETAGKIHRAMAVANNPGCLLLIDELDAIGETRDGGGTGAGKENNATVATLLQRLDAPVDGIVIGATNRVDMIDPAIRRRFDSVIELPSPSREQLEAFGCQLFARFNWEQPEDWEPEGGSFSAVEMQVADIVRSGVIAREGNSR